MKKQLLALFFLSGLFSLSAAAQDTALFPKGEVSTTNNHTGTVWLRELNQADSSLDINIATATFSAGSKLDWHIHPAGQILMITDGTGYYQEKGKPAQIVHKGDVIKCLPGVTHWHGAAPGSAFTYIAVSTRSKQNKTIWLDRVSDAEYQSIRQH